MIIRRIISCFAVALIAVSTIDAMDVVIQTPAQEQVILDVQAEDSFLEVMEAIEHHVTNDSAYEHLETQPLALNVVVSRNEICARSATPRYVNVPPRPYHEAITAQDKADIGFILRTTANKTLVEIAAKRSALKAAGDRIDHIHPLRFWHYVLTDEELKVCCKNVQGRSWVWKEWVDGIADSLRKEAAAGNITDEYLQDLTKAIDVKLELLMPSVHGGRWEEFINLLVTHVPRKGDPGKHRY